MSSERPSKKSHANVDPSISSVVRNKIVTLSFSQYAVGNLTIGYVLQIASNHVVISLPGGIIGIVSTRDISDILPTTDHDGEEAESNVSAIEPFKL